MHYPFANFLRDPAAYRQAERYWLDLWERTGPRQRSRHGWSTPWIQTSFADGTPMKDGNPIFIAISRKERRGLRVLQFEPQSDQLEFDYWLDVFGGDDTASPDAVQELVIACALSDQAGLMAELMIHAWISGQIRPEPADGALRLVTAKAAAS